MDEKGWGGGGGVGGGGGGGGGGWVGGGGGGVGKVRQDALLPMRTALFSVPVGNSSLLRLKKNEAKLKIARPAPQCVTWTEGGDHSPTWAEGGTSRCRGPRGEVLQNQSAYSALCFKEQRPKGVRRAEDHQV